MKYKTIMSLASCGAGALALAAVLCLLFLSPSAVSAKTDTDESAQVLSQFGDAMAKVAEKVKPAVVNISTSKTVRAQRNPFFDDPFFRRFFGESPQQKRRVANLGSGVIATADGYILTNNHVIEGAEDILVKLSDNKEHKGKVVGLDPKTDVAVIKIDAKGLPTLSWADSDRLKVGEMVLAVGNPFGLSQTITMGIISALGRSGIGITDYEDFIQTDAAINPGNSGGALVNTKGQLIGLNTAIFSTSGGYQGIGFAIPSNMVRGVIDSIISQGKVVRGWLGVQIQPLTPELAKQFDLKDEQGVLLVDIVEGGPADKGGLKRGDVIIEYDGKKIDSPFGLRNMVAATKPGSTVKLRVLREGKETTVTLTIEELSAEQQAMTGGLADNGLKGVTVQTVTDQILQSLGITKKLKGVVVTAVSEDSPAAGILTKGDIIVEVNRRPVENANQFNAVASKIDRNQTILLLIVRNNVSQYITIGGSEK